MSRVYTISTSYASESPLPPDGVTVRVPPNGSWGVISHKTPNERAPVKSALGVGESLRSWWRLWGSLRFVEAAETHL